MAVSGIGKYDPDNIFAKILRGEIPCKKVFEDDMVLAFHDIAPKAPVHVLVIPKGPYISFADFSQRASDKEIVAFNRAVGDIARKFDLDAPGYRLIGNIGENAGQEVPHFHVHLLGGRPLGPMLAE